MVFHAFLISEKILDFFPPAWPLINHSWRLESTLTRELKKFGNMSEGSWPWFHRSLGRMETERLLVDCSKDGCFLIRPSETKKGAYVLSLMWVPRFKAVPILLLLLVTVYRSRVEWQKKLLIQLFHPLKHNWEKQGKKRFKIVAFFGNGQQLIEFSLSHTHTHTQVFDVWPNAHVTTHIYSILCIIILLTTKLICVNLLFFKLSL